MRDHAELGSLSEGAMEQEMKVQDVVLQAMAKKITGWQAVVIPGIGGQHMRRWRERYVEEGYNVHQNLAAIRELDPHTDDYFEQPASWISFLLRFRSERRFR